MRVGVMLVGINGINASTLIAGCTAMKHKIIPKQYGITDYNIFDEVNFADVDDLVFSGWDYYNTNQSILLREYGVIKNPEVFSICDELEKIRPYKGIHTSKDIQLETQFNHYVEPKNIEEAIECIKQDIIHFKKSHFIDDAVMIYLGSPSKRSKEELKHISYSDFTKIGIDSIPSSLIYAVASILEGVHFVDFTPSETLEFSFLEALAVDNGVQIAGRDGSTGQTMLKMTIASMLKVRGLRLHSWYSTNILGNHDGYILAQPEYCETKINDKLNCLAPLLGYDDFEHKVTIDYFKTRFDSKESWDAIDFYGWLQTPMHLKLNWQGEDAILAAPMLLDIIRLMHFGSKKGFIGFQKQMGVFFKHPFGCTGMSLEDMFNMLINCYTK